MKNLQILISKEDVLHFTASLWRSRQFKEAAAVPGSYLARWSEAFSARPRMVLESSEPEVETAHFYSFMNALSLRSYPQPVLSDLYYLHEIVHIATMDYQQRLPYDSWRAKMVANELLASLESEVIVYFALPGLRELAFDFEIWADRFLLEKVRLSPEGKTNERFFLEDFFIFYNILRSCRVSISQRPKEERDAVEEMIAQYSRQNDLWAEIWRDKRAVVEDTLCHFNAVAIGDRKGAAAYLEKWIKKEASLGDGVPFREEAELFSAIYHLKKKKDQLVNALSKKAYKSSKTTRAGGAGRAADDSTGLNNK